MSNFFWKSESHMRKIAADVASRAHLFYASDDIQMIWKKHLDQTYYLADADHKCEQIILENVESATHIWSSLVCGRYEANWESYFVIRASVLASLLLFMLSLAKDESFFSLISKKAANLLLDMTS